MSASKPDLSVSFHNFWRTYRPKGSFFVKVLSTRYNVTIDRVGRDLQISSVFGAERLPAPSGGARPLRMWWTGESRDPAGQVFDLYFGFHRKMPLLDGRWHRFPLWVKSFDWWEPDSPRAPDRLLGPRQATDRPNFCNFIYSSQPSLRTEFFLRLNDARPVDSLGRVLNSVGRPLPGGKQAKIDALKDWRFTLAFENARMHGYVTEKIIEPFMAGSVPIYWGAPDVADDFNSAAFVNANEFDTMDDLIGHILRLDDSRDAYAEIAEAPVFRDNRIPYEHTPDFMVDRISDALSGTAEPVASRNWPIYWRNKKDNVFRKIAREYRRIKRSMIGGHQPP